MKKVLLLMLLFIGTMGAKAADDNITGALKVAADKKTAVLHVSLTNATSYVAFQMDVTLPDGWTVTSAEPVANTSRLTQTSTEGKADQVGDQKFNLAYNVIDGKKVRILAYNLANSHITGTSGDELFTVTLTKTGDAPAAVSDWTATFSDVLFVDKDLAGAALAVSNTNSKAVGESATLLGDVNNDGKVNTLDVAATIDIVLGNTTGYNLDAADVNGDNKVNTLDVASIIEITLNSTK